MTGSGSGSGVVLLILVTVVPTGIGVPITGGGTIVYGEKHELCIFVFLLNGVTGRCVVRQMNADVCLAGKRNVVSDTKRPFELRLSQGLFFRVRLHVFCSHSIPISDRWQN
jgi:hypothetical protein